jgi:phosphatidylserine decarboxylase
VSSVFARLFLFLQFLLPHYGLTALVFRVTRIRARRIKNFLIGHFVNLFDVDVTEIERSVPDGFETFNDFFTRELAGDARPVDPDDSVIVSPADGTLSAAGQIEGQQLFQAKGKRYSLDDLLATDLDEARQFVDGSFATIYLAPHNYHRVHAPLAGRLLTARHVPGDLFSVNAATVSLLPRLFCRNERLICRFDTVVGPVAVILVGALNVGSITTPWTGELRPRKRGVVSELALAETPSRQVGKGGLLGWFNLGSTVIVLLPPGAAHWDERLRAGHRLKTGQAIGRLRGAS